MAEVSLQLLLRRLKYTLHYGARNIKGCGTIRNIHCIFKKSAPLPSVSPPSNILHQIRVVISLCIYIPQQQQRRQHRFFTFLNSYQLFSRFSHFLFRYTAILPCRYSFPQLSNNYFINVPQSEKGNYCMFCKSFHTSCASFNQNIRTSLLQ